MVPMDFVRPIALRRCYRSAHFHTVPTPALRLNLRSHDTRKLQSGTNFRLLVGGAFGRARILWGIPGNLGSRSAVGVSLLGSVAAQSSSGDSLRPDATAVPAGRTNRRNAIGTSQNSATDHRHGPARDAVLA